MVGVRQPSFTAKCRILGDYWSQNRESLAENDVWSHFFAENRRALAVAYALSQQLGQDPTQRAINLIDETYVEFCDLLWLDAAYPFESLDEALSYSKDSPVPVKESRRESALKPQRVISGKRTLRGPGFAGVAAVAGVLMVVAVAFAANSARQPVEMENKPETTIEVDSNSENGFVPSTNGGGRSSGTSRREADEEEDDSVRFDFEQEVDQGAQDDRPVSGRGSGCKVGVADGDRCVGVRPIPGPRGPIPQPFSLPRDPLLRRQLLRSHRTWIARIPKTREPEVNHLGRRSAIN